MKIPETTANVGAYYANEENGQWQPNGVIIDSGVGGGVVGSGDAGVHRAPVYPVHVPRGHIPGPYVMAGAYYPPGTYPAAAAPPDDFADYMWMENEEEFDKQVMQQLEEEALMEQCIEAMLEDEQREQRQRPQANGHNHYPTSSNGQGSLSLEETVSRSTLNPLAAEFVPYRAKPSTEETTETQQQQQQPEQPTESKTEVESSKESEQTDTESKSDSKVEEPPQPSEPPEVSAADVQPIDDKEKRKETKRDTKKPEVKKNVKSDVKKTKPAPAKEKLEKKKSLKEDSVEIKQSSPQPEDTGIKPINYAAAAKAMKPKKPASPTADQQPAPAAALVADKKKDKPKTDKPTVQRKNSAK